MVDRRAAGIGSERAQHNLAPTIAARVGSQYVLVDTGSPVQASWFSLLERGERAGSDEAVEHSPPP